VTFESLLELVNEHNSDARAFNGNAVFVVNTMADICNRFHIFGYNQRIVV